MITVTSLAINTLSSSHDIVTTNSIGASESDIFSAGVMDIDLPIFGLIPRA